MKLLAATSLSWIALLVAIALWIGVGFFAWMISEEESARTSRFAEEEEQTLQQFTVLRLHALARETKEDRAELEESAHRDVEEMLDAITTAGKDAGIPITIGQSLSVSAPKENSSLRAVALIVDAQGTFAQVVQAMALLESLSLPSSLNELQFEQLSETRGSGRSRVNLWRVVARIQFLTTADLPT